jgi:hypothetical protein
MNFHPLARGLRVHGDHHLPARVAQPPMMRRIGRGSVNSRQSRALSDAA